MSVGCAPQGGAHRSDELVVRKRTLRVLISVRFNRPLPLIMRAVLSSLILAALLAACGYKGPLYLPKPKPEAQQQPPSAKQEPKTDASRSLSDPGSESGASLASTNS